MQIAKGAKLVCWIQGLAGLVLCFNCCTPRTNVSIVKSVETTADGLEPVAHVEDVTGIFDAAERRDSAALEQIEKWLIGENDIVRVSVLDEIGPSLKDVLRTHLEGLRKSTNAYVRLGLLEALERCGLSEGDAVADDMFRHDDDKDVRYKAAEYLCYNKGVAACAWLRQKDEAPCNEARARGTAIGMQMASDADYRWLVGSVVVARVCAASPAERVGLVAADRLISINGKQIEERSDAAAIIADAVTGKAFPLTIEVLRNDRRKVLSLSDVRW